MMRKNIKRKVLATISALALAFSMIPTSLADEVDTDASRLEFVNQLDSVNMEEKTSDTQGVEIKLEMVNVDSEGRLEKIGSTGLETESKLDSDNQKQSGSMTSLSGSNRYQTAVKISQNGWPRGAQNVVLVNSSSTISGTMATPLATTYNAPILLSSNQTLNPNTLTEIKRLRPRKIYIIGDTRALSSNIERSIKSMGISTVRLSGATVGQTSAKIANEISRHHDVDTSYVVSIQNGSADALSIAAQAGRTKNPVLVSNASVLNSDAMNFIRNNTPNVYYIGGTGSINTSLLSRISSIVANGSEANRISGVDRHDTNAKIISKFFGKGPFSNMLIAKSDDIGMIDTVAAGPLAAMKNAPILITKKDRIQRATNKYISGIRASNLIQVGGGFSYSVTSGLQRALFGISSNPSPAPRPSQPSPRPQVTPSRGIKGKTIIIDPGHGGRDTGAVGLNGYKEKDWTLVTAHACADYLRRAGAKVIMTRTDDTYPTLPERADLSNNEGAVLFCSIHYNKGGNLVNADTGELSGNGVEVYKGKGQFANSVANKILNNILNNFNLRNRGVKDGTHLYVISNTNAPAILVEGGFVSSSRDVNQLKYKDAQKKMGIQIAKGIVAAFN